MRGRVLIVAGSDSGGGAGIQADIKTVTALGGYAATAITALTAQNSRGVADILPVPADFVARQMRVVLEDIGADALKTGMLGDAAVIAAVVETIVALAPGAPLVVDPVMVAKGGARLLNPDAIDAVKRLLAPRATLLTPNIPEAEALSGSAIGDVAAQRRVAVMLLALGSGAVLLKGGHLESGEVTDVLATRDRVEIFSGSRIASTSTHGTGCTLASAIAVGLAQGLSLTESIVRAREYVRKAIATAPGYGAGNGPLNHAHTLER